MLFLRPHRASGGGLAEGQPVGTATAGALDTDHVAVGVLQVGVMAGPQSGKTPSSHRSGSWPKKKHLSPRSTRISCSTQTQLPFSAQT